MIGLVWHGYTMPQRADACEALPKTDVVEGIDGQRYEPRDSRCC